MKTNDALSDELDWNNMYTNLIDVGIKQYTNNSHNIMLLWPLTYPSLRVLDGSICHKHSPWQLCSATGQGCVLGKVERVTDLVGVCLGTSDSLWTQTCLSTLLPRTQQYCRKIEFAFIMIGTHNHVQKLSNMVATQQNVLLSRFQL